MIKEGSDMTITQIEDETPQTEIPVERAERVMRADQHYGMARTLLASAVQGMRAGSLPTEVAAVLVAAADVEARLAAVCGGAVR